MNNKLKYAFILGLVIIAVVVGIITNKKADEMVILKELPIPEASEGDAEKAKVEDGDTFGEPENKQENIKESKTEIATDDEPNISDEIILVHVCGEVVNPGVYELTARSRIFEAVNMAGGFTENAASDYINLAEYVTDGSRIYIPSYEEIADEATPPCVTIADEGNADKSTQKINLNTATKEELMTLPYVGESKADSIIGYRTEHGGFSSIEEIMSIPGIKNGLFDKIKDKICV